MIIQDENIHDSRFSLFVEHHSWMQMQLNTWMFAASHRMKNMFYKKELAPSEVVYLRNERKALYKVILFHCHILRYWGKVFLFLFWRSVYESVHKC